MASRRAGGARRLSTASPGAPDTAVAGPEGASRGGLGPVGDQIVGVKPFPDLIGSWWRCRPRRGSSADAGPSRPSRLRLFVGGGCACVTCVPPGIGRGGFPPGCNLGRGGRRCSIAATCALIPVCTLSRHIAIGPLNNFETLPARAIETQSRNVAAALRRRQAPAVRWHRQRGPTRHEA